jgi:uncharacterized protein YggE
MRRIILKEKFAYDENNSNKTMDFAGKFMDEAYEKASQAASAFKAKPQKIYSKEEKKSERKKMIADMAKMGITRKKNKK